MFRQNGFVSLLLVCGICGPSAMGLGQDASSLLHAVALNNSALRSFDVLIRHEAFQDIASDDYERAVVLKRLRFDWDRDRYLGMTKSISDTLIDGETEEDVWGTATQMSGFVLVAGVSTAGPVPGRMVTTQGDARSVFARADVPDLRFGGVAEYPQIFVKTGVAGAFESIEQALSNGNGFTETTLPDGKIRVTHSTPIFGYPDQRTTTQWDIAPDSLMPVAHSRAIAFRKPDGSTELKKQYWEQIEWEQRADIYVPVRITSERVSSSLPKKYRKLPMRERLDKAKADGVQATLHPISTTVEFHWFSVNEPLDAKDFSKAPLSSAAELEKLVDPIASGATTLNDEEADVSR